MGRGGQHIVGHADKIDHRNVGQARLLTLLPLDCAVVLTAELWPTLTDAEKGDAKAVRTDEASSPVLNHAFNGLVREPHHTI